MNTEVVLDRVPEKTLDALEEANLHIAFLQQQLNVARALWQDALSEAERLRQALRLEKDARERIQSDYVEAQRRTAASQGD